MKPLKLLRRIRRKKPLFIFLTLLFLLLATLLFSLLKTFAQYTPSITVSPNVYFCLSPYDTEINFQSQQPFNSLRLDNSSWYWYFDGYGFQVQNANMTITSFFTNNKLIFELNGTGTSATKIYVAEKGEPKTVKGASSWSYDDGTKILTIILVHASPGILEIVWPIISPILIDAAQQAAQIFSIVLIIGIIHAIGTNKSIQWCILLVLSSVSMLIIVLILANAPLI